LLYGLPALQNLNFFYTVLLKHWDMFLPLIFAGLLRKEFECELVPRKNALAE